jgi:hypothetical protein
VRAQPVELGIYNQHSKMPTDVLEESRQTTHSSWYSGAA